MCTYAPVATAYIYILISNITFKVVALDLWDLFYMSF